MGPLHGPVKERSHGEWGLQEDQEGDCMQAMAMCDLLVT